METTWNVRQVLSIPLTVGGGVRDITDARALLDAGADRVAVNTAAVERPELLKEVAGRYGSQCTVLAVDAARCESGWEVVVNGGRTRTGIDVTAWVEDAATLGAGEILLTSWDRDGTRSGYDLDLITAVTSAVSIPVIASGGADNSSHLEEALGSGASAVLIASILHDGETTVDTLKSELLAAGQEVRP